MEFHAGQRKEMKCIKNTMNTIESTTSDETNGEEQVSSCIDEMKKLSVSVINAKDRPKTSVTNKFLLVLDVNGLLADIVSPPPEGHKPDATIGWRAIFKRPFYLEFLNFCFEKFEVAVWSSRNKKNVNTVVDYLMGNMKHKLLFCWDHSHCTETNFKTRENMDKPLVFKDLSKIWEKHDTNLPWEKGYYNESNTLLLDESPYKALLNPPHNSVFPHTFRFHYQSDNSLGAGGDLRQYLNGLASAENVPKYVEKHPFGQEGITKRSESWSFYQQVIGSLTENTSAHSAY